MKMKLLAIMTLAFSMLAFAADDVPAKPLNGKVKFDDPTRYANKDVVQALWERKSATEFTERVISQKDLGNILWAANGINRPESGNRTAPSALNKQDISLYVFDKQNVFLYDPKTHTMNVVVKGDRRYLFTERMKTPVIILLVSDVGKFDRGPEEDRKLMGAADAGLVSQNISLYCAGIGVDTRVRASMDKPGLQKLLGLNDKQIPMLNHAVGYSK